ncbi:MAG: sulfatase [Planctomycetaceae bacterium]|nr:sulfatase [Planctomycetaceae bacterium]
MSRAAIRVVLLATLATACASPAPRPPRASPNVVLIFTDDQGWADVGCQGARGFSTPNLDRLASEGARLTNFYAAQPVCSASRAAILTGCYPNRIGIAGALAPSSTHGLAQSETTLAELLKERGYATALFGKWHLGHLPQFLPTRHGFDEWFGVPYSHDMWPFHPDGPKPWTDLPRMRGDTVLELNPDPGTWTRAVSEEALRFVREHADEPFFLYLPHPLPHVPLGTSPEFRGRTATAYGDVIEELDHETGRLLALLDELDLARDTIVIFASDNGPWTPYGEHAGNVGPLRESKGTVFEGGVRVPCIVRWPGHVPAGRVIDEPAMTIDVLPTVAAWTGARAPELPIDGCDISATLEARPHDTSPRPFFFWYESNELQAVRYGRWKLHFPHSYRFTDEMERATGGRPAKYPVRQLELSLFDLETDLGERHDVSAEHPTVVAQLSGLAQAMRVRLGDSLRGVRGTENRPAGRASD